MKSSDSSSSLLFGPFPSVPGQHMAEWPQFLAAITTFALNVPTGQDGGLVGFFLDPQLYALDYGHAFVPFPPAGPYPANNAGQQAWSAHKEMTSNRKLEITSINSLMQNIFDSLDRVAKSFFFEPLRNRYNMAPDNFILVMTREYGIADTELISKWINTLQEPMSPSSSIRDLVTLHRELHAKLNNARGYIMHQDEAVRGLVQATQFSSVRSSVVQWLTEHRGANNQHFDVLATYLCQIELVTSSLSAPSVGTKYAAPQVNHILNPIQPELNAVASTSITNADILKAIQSLVFAVAKGTTTSRAASFKPKSSTDSEYCWTHGHCAHSSASCKKPSSGHVFTATTSNMCGGNSAKWVRPTIK